MLRDLPSREGPDSNSKMCRVSDMIPVALCMHHVVVARGQTTIAGRWGEWRCGELSAKSYCHEEPTASCSKLWAEKNAESSSVLRQPCPLGPSTQCRRAAHPEETLSSAPSGQHRGRIRSSSVFPLSKQPIRISDPRCATSNAAFGVVYIVIGFA